MVKKLILIVEDNERNRRLIRDVLRFKGYETMESETAEAGLQLAREFRPALILMDIELPGMSGIEALGDLRANHETQSIPVIAVTASSATSTFPAGWACLTIGSPTWRPASSVARSI